MIKIYDSADYNLTVCLANVQPTKAIIYKDADEYYAELEFPHKFTFDSGKTELYSPILKANNIAVIKTPWGNQPFYLDASEISPRSIKIKAQHVSRILKRYAIPDKTGEYRPPLYQALDLTMELSGADSIFSVDIQDDPNMIPAEITFPWGYNDKYNFWGNEEIEVDTTNAYGALKLIEYVYYKKIEFDGFTIIVKPRPTATTPDIILRNAKNIDDIKITENWDNVCTKCVAVGYRGLRATYEIPSNPYAYKFDRIVEFEPPSNIDHEDDEAIIADLLYKAQAYVESHINPEVSYTVKATPDVNVDIGDPVKIKYSELINLTATILSIIYDAVTGKYVQVEFGNYKPTIKGLQTRINNQIKSLKIRLGQGGL